MHAALAALLVVIAGGGQFTVVADGDRKIAVSGIIQPQFHAQRADGGKEQDDWLFRRLIADAQIAASRDWSADLQVDFGESAIALRNAYVQYGGWRPHGVTIAAGHLKLPFSRSYTSPGSKRETPERPFTGDRNFAIPNRILGARVDVASALHRLQWSAAVGLEEQIADARRITFDSPTAAATAATTRGPIVGGRVEGHLFGETPRDQGDFHTDSWRLVLALAAFRWQNDGARTSGTNADLDRAEGGEASAGLRGHGVSVDVEIHRAQGIAKDRTLTAGIYRRGVGAMHTASVEGGYMLPRDVIELVVAYDSFDALAYTRPWRRFSTGANAYLHRQNLKLQLADRISRHVDGGVSGRREVFAQLQLLF